MDGSFAKADRFEDCYGKEALKSKDVDILDYHYYGSECIICLQTKVQADFHNSRRCYSSEERDELCTQVWKGVRIH